MSERKRESVCVCVEGNLGRFYLLSHESIDTKIILVWSDANTIFLMVVRHEPYLKI